MEFWKIDMNNALFGPGVRLLTGEKMKEFNATKVLIVHDTVMKELGYADELVENIKAAGLDAVLYEMEPGEPSSGKVDRAYEQVLAMGGIDGIVGLGGGAAMDTAKMIGKLLVNGGKSEDYLGYTNTTVAKPFHPLIALPTTAGTGSEVNGGLVCEIESQHLKATSPASATLALIDPTYTYKLPKSITASTGIDAMAHAIESLCNSASMPNWMADTLGKETVKLGLKWLPLAYAGGPENEEARNWMSYIAALGGYTVWLRKSTFGHAIANQLSNAFHIPHGVGCGIGLAAVMRYNITGDYAATRLLAPCFGIDCPEDANMEEVGQKVFEKFDALLKELELPSMKKLGIPESFIAEAAAGIRSDTKWAIVPNPPDFDLMEKCMHDSYDF